MECPWSFDPAPPDWFQTKRVNTLLMPCAQAWLASVGHSPVTLNGVLVESGHPTLLQTGDTFEVSVPRSRRSPHRLVPSLSHGYIAALPAAEP